MDFDFSDDQESLRDAVRKWVDKGYNFDRRRALARAKYQIGQSMRFVGQQSVQMHGGIAVTDEYIVSHYFKKLTQLEMTFGDSLHQLGEVSNRMLDTTGVFA